MEIRPYDWWEAELLVVLVAVVNAFSFSLSRVSICVRVSKDPRQGLLKVINVKKTVV